MQESVEKQYGKDVGCVVGKPRGGGKPFQTMGKGDVGLWKEEIQAQEDRSRVKEVCHQDACDNAGFRWPVLANGAEEAAGQAAKGHARAKAQHKAFRWRAAQEGREDLIRTGYGGDGRLPDACQAKDAAKDCSGKGTEHVGSEEHGDGHEGDGDGLYHNVAEG